MKHFQTEEERRLKLSAAYPEAYELHPRVITQRQAAQISGMHLRTIRNWQASGELPFKRRHAGKHRYHVILLDDLMECVYIKQGLFMDDGEALAQLRQFYSEKLTKQSDVLRIDDVSQITGYSTSAVGKWINEGYLKAMQHGRRFLIPKPYFIEFLCSSHYKVKTNQGCRKKADVQSSPGKKQIKNLGERSSV